MRLRALTSPDGSRMLLDVDLITMVREISVTRRLASDYLKLAKSEISISSHGFVVQESIDEIRELIEEKIR